MQYIKRVHRILKTNGSGIVFSCLLSMFLRGVTQFFHFGLYRVLWPNSSYIYIYINLRSLLLCLAVRVGGCLCASDPRFIQLALGSCYALHINVNIIKVHIERKNMQVEVIRFRQKISNLFTFTFAKRGIFRPMECLCSAIDGSVWRCTTDGSVWCCATDGSVWRCTTDGSVWRCTTDGSVWCCATDGSVWRCTTDGSVWCCATDGSVWCCATV